MMEPFPAKERKAQRPYSRVQYEVFCSCRLMRGDANVMVAMNGTTKLVKLFHLLFSRRRMNDFVVLATFCDSFAL